MKKSLLFGGHVVYIHRAMSENNEAILDKALARLAELDAQLAPLQAERRKLRSFVNQICEFLGREPMFADDTEIAEVSVSPQPIAPENLSRTILQKKIRLGHDAFFSVPLATAVRMYLEMRKTADLGPATTEEIHQALVQGGFEFPTSDDREQRRGLQVSISKNTQTFRKLPNGRYGLAEWYKAARRLI